ncbi:hypothetical protein TRFO_32860 [Tritrichomonas foetus]|uniref:Uncharacterized protein n=1 Tax=Tritrichomonas foetus TaxID=1144522 RepID=A0A1J4JSF6_9EUKA|nr:hypothetical protein TRFO_32860 [Tritrichomonas foetus]|eukprot:OHT00454.1 hypothetical protein TRFO_32860 [Tritrichomonas foetus]
MNYKKLPLFFQHSIFQFTDNDFVEIIHQSSKLSFDGKTELQYKPIRFYPELNTIIENLKNIINVDDSFLHLESYISLDKNRPDPNELLLETPLLNLILEYMFSTDNINYISSCFGVLIHLSLADQKSESPLFSHEFFQFIRNFMNDKYPQILLLVLEVLNNLVLDQNFLEDQIMVFLENGIPDLLVQLCLSTNTPKMNYFSLQISSNICRNMTDNNYFEGLKAFKNFVPFAISLLKPNYSMTIAIELLSFLLFDRECCEYSLQYNVIEMLKNSLDYLSEDSISNTYISINSLIQIMNLSNEFVDSTLIQKTLTFIQNDDIQDTRPLFLFLYSLCDEHWKLLGSLEVPQFLIFCIMSAPLCVQKKAVLVLSHLIINFLPQIPHPSWYFEAISNVVEHIHGLSIRKTEQVLEDIIKINDSDHQLFMSCIQHFDFEGCLEDIKEKDLINEQILKYVDYLYNSTLG